MGEKYTSFISEDQLIGKMLYFVENYFFDWVKRMSWPGIESRNFYLQDWRFVSKTIMIQLYFSLNCKKEFQYLFTQSQSDDGMESMKYMFLPMLNGISNGCGLSCWSFYSVNQIFCLKTISMRKPDWFVSLKSLILTL